MSKTTQANDTNHTAWRFNFDGVPMYVEAINYSGKGDRYSYTSTEANALKITQAQARAFCAYMRDCSTVGFWS